MIADKERTSLPIKMNRVVSFILVLLFLVAGCAPRKAQKAKVTVWHWMTDRKDAFSELAKKYKEEKGIEVEFKLFFPPDIYSQKVIAAARAQNLPEIFGILGEKKTLASFIKAGHVVDLSPYMQANTNQWKNRFYSPTLKIVIFRKRNIHGVALGIYGVPIDTTVMQFVYTKSLFKKAGFDPDAYPRDFLDFIDYAQKIKEKEGVDGFVCGWAEGWLLNALATEWAINLMGENKFLKTIKGKVPYTDSDWIEVFSLFKKLKDSGVLAANVATMTNKESEDAFSKGKAAFSFNGSWSVNVYKQLNPDLDYGFFSLPKVSKRFPLKIWGGAGSSFMVNVNSAQKEEAIEFLKWLTEKEQQQFLIKETNNLPSIKSCERGLPSILENLIGALDNLTHPDIWPQNEDSRVIEIMNRGLQQIVMGLKTPETVAQEIQKTKERISRR